jgi:superfamily II DNA or RNA helicase
MFTLHPYQVELSLKTRTALATYRKVLMCSPTGSGKTVIAGDIFARAHAKGVKPVFLTDRIEIAQKTKETFEQFGLSVQLITADTKQVYKSDCIIAMAETFYRRCMSGWFPKHIVKLLFCDEAHMSVFNKSIELFPEAYIVGLTATPVSAAFNLNKTYQKIIMGPTTPELIQAGFLCPSVDIGQRDFLELKYERGDFSQESQREAFSSYGLSQKMLTLWKHHASDRSTICYNIDIAHNEEMEAVFKAAGVSTCSITGKTNDKEREDAIRDYNVGKIQVMLNVGVATKGFDSPITSCIVANFSTASMSKWFQVTGRGARLNPGKDNFITLDMGNNILRHGSYNDTIDWEYLFHNPEQDIRKTTPPPKYLCNVCLAYVTNIHLPDCPVCDTKITLKNLIKLESQMPEALANKNTKDMTLQELNTYAKFKGYKRGWAWRQNEMNQLAQRSRMRQGRLF